MNNLNVLINTPQAPHHLPGYISQMVSLATPWVDSHYQRVEIGHHGSRPTVSESYQEHLLFVESSLEHAQTE